MKGPAGYGRYDDDLAYVGCPRARSDMSPCVARDGRRALDADEVCVHCASSPEDLADELAEAYGPARELLATGDPVTLAGKFAAMVREITEPGRRADDPA